MDLIRPLPARELLLPGESLVSLIRRTTTAMGYENTVYVRKLISKDNLAIGRVNQLRDLELDNLESLFRQPLSAATVHRYANQLLLAPQINADKLRCDSKTIVKYFQMARPPVCPCCLAEGDVGYERLPWSIRAIPVCFTHRSYLVANCPKCRRQLRPDRIDVSKCQCGFDLRNATSGFLNGESFVVAKQLSECFEGKQVPAGFERSCEALWWMERLVSSIRRTPDWLANMASRFGVPFDEFFEFAAWLSAAEMLSDWPLKLFEFLQAFQRTPKHRTTNTGLSRSFGLLLREAKQLEEFGCGTPADALRLYLAEHYTAGHVTSKTCLFSQAQHRELLRNRPWVALTEADEILRFRKGGSATLLERGLLEGSVRSASTARSVGLVSRESIKRVAGELKTAFSVAAAVAAMGLGRSRVLEMIKLDMLPRAIWTRGGWRIPRASVTHWIEWVDKLPVARVSNSEWIGSGDATRRFGPTGLSLIGLIRLIDGGDVGARRKSDEAKFCQLIVSLPDLKRSTPQIRQQRSIVSGFPLNQLTKQLFPERPIKASVLKKWIEIGLLRATKDGRGWKVSPAEIERFHSQYCLLNDAASHLGIHANTLRRWISEDRFEPVYGPRSTSGGGFYLLRLAEVLAFRDTTKDFGSH